MWDLERKYSGGRDANDFRETVFAVVREGARFKFEVIESKIFLVPISSPPPPSAGEGDSNSGKSF